MSLSALATLHSHIRSKARVFCTLLCLLAVVGCSSLNSENEQKRKYPPPEKDIPHYEHFVAIYTEDKANAQKQSYESYITWVQRFYHGWLLHETGWLETSDMVLGKISDPTESALVAEQLEFVGKTISAEWAKDNDHDYISTQVLASLGESLEEASSRGTVSSFLEQVEQDLQQLESGELGANDIKIERYFPDMADDDDGWNYFF